MILHSSRRAFLTVTLQRLRSGWLSWAGRAFAQSPLGPVLDGLASGRAD